MSVAAIFEEQFSMDWLLEVTGLRATTVLAVLEAAAGQHEFVRREPGVYVFADAKRRRTWLASIPEDEKDRYYRAIVKTLLREPGDDDEKALRVAGYLRCIPNNAEGCKWLVRAGKVYATSSTESAIECFTKVADDLAGRQGDAEDSLFVTAVLEYSNAATLRSDTLKTLSLLNEARVRAERLGDKNLILLTEMHVAKHEWIRSHEARALKRFETALAEIEKTGDRELLSATTDLKNFFLFWQGRLRDVIATYEASLSDVEDYPSGTFPVFAAITVGRSYAITGQLTQGLGMLHTIYDRCMEKGNLFLASHAASAIAVLMLGIGRFEDAFRYFKFSLRQAIRSENQHVELIDTFMLALAHKRKGEIEESLRYLRRFLKHLRESHVSAQLYPYLMEICWDMEVGTFPRLAGLSLERELKEMLGFDNVLVKGIAYRYQALLGRRGGWSNQRIVRSLNISAKLLHESGHQLEWARTQVELARSYLSIEDLKKVKRTMRIVSEILSFSPELIPDELRPFVYAPNRKESVLAGILDLDAETIAAAREKNQLLQLVVTTVNRLIGAERGAIFLAGGESTPSDLHLKASKNLTVEQTRGADFSPLKNVMAEVISLGKGRVFEIRPAEEDSLETEPIHSAICVPFFLEDKSAGVLYHDNRLLSNIFSESDLRLLGFFAGMVATELNLGKARQEVQALTEAHRSGVTVEADPAEYDCAAFADGLIGTSPAIKRIRAEIGRVARMDTSVLILGETGVGKNLVAAAIHRQSLRADGPFVIVQCSALTESLVTSELFGHEKGAFTGATNRRIGRFEMADRGTLFLDEIGDLSPDVQVRLLRVLQSREFERVGGGRETLTSDFRLVAATNRNLKDDVEANTFRKDLYYRISVFPLHVPPLRERREDIPLLARHFLKIYAARNRQTIEEIPRAAMERLVGYDWPGNIREMENAIQRGIVLGQGRRFLLPDLGLTSDLPTANASSGRPGTLEENERNLILKVLKQTGWRIYGPHGAAVILAMKPTTLCSRMKKLGIRRPLANPGE
jgi:transcriptional regulator with GAF, ATPase, and Fis domain/tetratricopeptide (TPR) repeat protein